MRRKAERIIAVLLRVDHLFRAKTPSPIRGAHLRAAGTPIKPRLLVLWPMDQVSKPPFQGHDSHANHSTGLSHLCPCCLCYVSGWASLILRKLVADGAKNNIAWITEYKDNNIIRTHGLWQKYMLIDMGMGRQEGNVN